MHQPGDNQQRRRLRQIGHRLSPVVLLGAKGLSESVQAEIHRALEDHELIKVRVVVADRDEKKSLIQQICAQCGAELIQQTGHIALLYRSNPNANPKLSNLHRFS